MCRIAFINKVDLAKLSALDLETVFSELERSQGGDGNGIAALDSSGKIHLRKGLRYDTMDAAIFAKSARFEWVLFHTRAASQGYLDDASCHPFYLAGGRPTVIAHNGTWGDSTNVLMMLWLANQLPERALLWSDTRLLAWIASRKGITFLQVLARKGRHTFVVYQDGVVKLINGRDFGYFEYKGARIYASEPVGTEKWMEFGSNPITEAILWPRLRMIRGDIKSAYHYSYVSYRYDRDAKRWNGYAGGRV